MKEESAKKTPEEILKDFAKRNKALATYLDLKADLEKKYGVSFNRKDKAEKAA